MSQSSGMGFSGIVSIPIPDDGPINFVLTKETALNYDTEWLAPPSIANPLGCIYITGDADTDGSIRICSTVGDPISHIELRENGVFNDTSFRFSASGSVQIGRDLDLAATAGFLETGNPSQTIGHIRSLIPHIQFEDAGTEHPHTPILDAEEIFDVFTGAVSEIVATVIGIDLGVSPGRVLEESIHEVGSVSSTQPVQVSFYLGTDNTGFLIDRRTLPANAMVTNTTLEIIYDNDLGFQAGQQVFMEFLSTANISLKTDSGGNALTKHEAHELDVLQLVTENLIWNNSLDHVLDNSLNPVYANQF